MVPKSTFCSSFIPLVQTPSLDHGNTSNHIAHYLAFIYFGDKTAEFIDVLAALTLSTKKRKEIKKD